MLVKIWDMLPSINVVIPLGLHFQLGAVLPQGHLVVSGSIFGSHKGSQILLASSEFRPGMLLNNQQYTTKYYLTHNINSATIFH